jgi:signal transduction histidine kinase/ActR/RegA family two-component response regulator
MTLDFSTQYLQATLIVSLLSVWVLVGLFAYLNRYTKRSYFTVWTAAWLFYALWLTMSLTIENKGEMAGIGPVLKQWCVSVSAVFLLWGSLNFLNWQVRQTLLGLFMAFLLAWTLASPQILASTLWVQLPVFILIGLGSIFAATCFYRLRKSMPYVGAGMLSSGFLLWGLYLISYPFTQRPGYEHLYNAGFLVAAVLQLFIAVSMIVLVLEEVRYAAEQCVADAARARSEKEELQSRILSTEEKCRSLYDQARLTEGAQKAYEELRRTQQVVVQQERLRALGQMTSGIAHDINNSLSPIVAYSELLVSTLPQIPESARRQLRAIQQAGEDIACIIARMREFYRKRPDTERLAKVNLNKAIEETIELTRPRWRDLPQRAGVSIDLRTELTPGLPSLLGDPSELREALTNLIFNAVDALPHGGAIVIATHLAPHSEKTVLLEVRDNGVGMEDHVRERCLEPFFTTKSQRGGSGLGLPMVYGVMQRQEGTIEIDSKPGHGTTIRLGFPIRSSSPESIPPDATPTHSRGALRILCIDDEPRVRELLAECLPTFRHTVEIATNGQEGIDMFRAAARTGRPYQTVVTDLGMPGVDGHQVARVVKAESPHTPVVMITGWGFMIKEEAETIPNVDAVVGKPPNMAQLNELLLSLATAATAAN